LAAVHNGRYCKNYTRDRDKASGRCCRDQIAKITAIVCGILSMTMASVETGTACFRINLVQDRAQSDPCRAREVYKLWTKLYKFGLLIFINSCRVADERALRKFHCSGRGKKALWISDYILKKIGIIFVHS